MEKTTNSAEYKVFKDYIKAIDKKLAAGYASEGSHYSSLEALLECLR